MAATAIYTPSESGSFPRPGTAMGYFPGEEDIRLGEDSLAPAFQEQLQTYMKKTDSPADQRKALELLTSLQLAEEAKELNRPLNRPKTAMATLAHPKIGNLMDPYLTTYQREYHDKEENTTTAERPKTSREFSASYNIGDPIGRTTYDEEYFRKLRKRTEPIRTGTASGSRKNNPHPPESFMVWKFAQRQAPEGEYSEWSTPLTDQVIDQVLKNKFKSTYQNDFLGIPQGFQMKSAFNNSADWKSSAPYTLDSCMRYSYQQPNQVSVLKGNNTRYGCNKKKLVPAYGSVPTVSTQQMNIKTRTTYEREYNEQPRSGSASTRVKDVTKALGAQAVQNYLASNRLDTKDKELLSNMLATVQGRTSRGSSRSSSRRGIPESTADLYTTGPTWCSTWTGPI